MPEGQELDALRAKVAAACRVLAHQGLVENVLGHVSARVDEDRMLIRARGPAERGLRFTEPRDVVLVDLNGTIREPLAEDYAVPKEVAIHGELLRARPEVGSVVHAHPPSALIAGLAGVPLRPVFGAYNIPAMRLALDGIPVWPRSVLVTRPELAHEMITAMAGRPVCLLRGHGITVTGDRVEQATVRALDLHALAAASVQLAALGVAPEPVPEEDLAELPDLGSSFNDELLWRYYTAVEAASAASPLSR